jgi:hypothetical protein
MVASSAMAVVKRARFAFTSLHLVSEIAPRSGGRAASSGSRSLALRPRLAAGLPWTALQRRTIVVLGQNARAIGGRDE